MTTTQKNEFIDRLRAEYVEAYDALVSLIDYCPDELWNQKRGGYLIGQQLLHPIADSVYYLRLEGQSEELNAPVKARIDQLQPDLKAVATEVLSKAELKTIAVAHREQIDRWFSVLADCALDPSFTDEGNTNLRTTLMNMRHLAYHAGHVDSVLHEMGMKGPGWGYLS